MTTYDGPKGLILDVYRNAARLRDFPPEPDLQEITSRIRSHMGDKKIRRKALALAAGIGRTPLGAKLDDQSPFTLAELLAVARALGKSWIWAMTGVDLVDCTNGGITSTHGRVTVVGTLRGGETVQPLPRNAQVFTPDDEAPAVILVECRIPEFGPHLETLEHVYDRLLGLPRNYVGPMAGGNFAGTSDGRFRDIVRDVFGHGADGGIVPVHDRVETPAQYRALSSD